MRKRGRRRVFPKLAPDAKMILNTETGVVTLEIQGNFKSFGVESATVKIFNAVQDYARRSVRKASRRANDELRRRHKLETGQKLKGLKTKELIYFTPEFPIYNSAQDVTICRFNPNNREKLPLEEFLAEVRRELDRYIELFYVDALRTFLADQDGYTAYVEAVKSGNYTEAKRVTEDFILKYGLPIPKSKKKPCIILNEIDSLYLRNGSEAEIREKISELLAYASGD